MVTELIAAAVAVAAGGAWTAVLVSQGPACDPRSRTETKEQGS